MGVYMPDLNQSYYVILAVLMFLLVLIYVPRPEIKKLFWFGLLWGSGVDFLLAELFRLFNLYHYVHAFPFEFYSSPIMINLAWSQAIILFIYFLPQRKEGYVFPIYLAVFAIVGVFIGTILKNVGLIAEIHWHELLRFPVWVIWFYGAAWHYRRLKSRDTMTI
jgi:hypothetical protein